MVTGIPDDGIFLFSRKNGEWELINELKSFETQNLINRRLCHVMVTGSEITFVYNNRIRKYSLDDGSLSENQQIQGAGKKEYPGTDIMQQIVPKWMRK